MRKRIEGTISEDNYAYFMSLCDSHERGPSFVLDKIISKARTERFDLTSGQARGLEEWMAKHGAGATA